MNSTSSHSPEVLDERRAWELLLALAHRPDAELPGAFSGRKTPGARELLDLYLPLCAGANRRHLVIAHLGQSLDGRIATHNGASRYVSGPDNIRHLHRLRALSHAVVVGASTVELDDPQLTTRLVRGDSPIRVVIDPSLRLSERHRIFQDGAARTLVVCARGRGHARRLGRAEVLELESRDGTLAASDVVAALAGMGLERLFIEGGGITVSRFLHGKALHRLHVTVCPVFIGSGKSGISLPKIDRLDQALRPSTRRFFLGDDVLFDCQLDHDR